MQRNLPFDKQQYAAAMRGLEAFEFPGSEQNAKLLRQFFIRLFRGETFERGKMRPISSPDGTTTRRVRELASIFELSERTVKRRLRAGVAAGLIEKVIDTDEHGVKRTTIAFVWRAVIRDSSETKGPPCHHQRATVSLPKGHDGTLHINRTRTRSQLNTNNQLLQQASPSEDRRTNVGGSSGIERELAEYGIEYPRQCVEGAKRIGYADEDVRRMMQRAFPPRALAKHLIHGTALPVKKRPTRSPEQVREDIVWRMRRSGATEEAIDRAVAEAIGRCGG